MKIDHCFIMAAGKGTRMGEVGTSLPKVLWPVFEKSLLSAQVDFSQSFRVRNIFANFYFQKKVILDYCHRDPTVKKIRPSLEEEVLDIGGGIHQMAAGGEVHYQGTALVVNCDQFVFFDPAQLETAFSHLKDCPAVLFAHEVSSRKKYNELVLDKDRCLREIVPNSQKGPVTNHLTYTGLCLLNLGLLEAQKGKSSFFESVADYRRKRVKVVILENFEYWDFGTVARFMESSFDLLKEAADLKRGKIRAPGRFLKFCLDSGIMDLAKVQEDLLSYGLTKIPSTINLTPTEISHGCGGKVVVIDERPERVIGRPGVYFQDKFSAF